MNFSTYSCIDKGLLRRLSQKGSHCLEKWGQSPNFYLALISDRIAADYPEIDRAQPLSNVTVRQERSTPKVPSTPKVQLYCIVRLGPALSFPFSTASYPLTASYDPSYHSQPPPARPKMTPSSPPKPMLDWEYYPHIRDLILHHAPDEAIPNLRLTCRTVRDYLDAQLSRHILYVISKGRLYTRRGHVQLCFQTPEVAPRIQAMDIYTPADQFEPGDPVALDLPNLEYARLPHIARLPDRSGLRYVRDVLPSVVPAPRCVIHAVGFSPPPLEAPVPRWQPVLLTPWVSERTQKSIFVLPPMKSRAMIDEGIRYGSPSSGGGVAEIVLVLLPPADLPEASISASTSTPGSESALGSGSRSRKTFGKQLESFKPFFGEALNSRHGGPNNGGPRGTLTLVGLEGLTRTQVGAKNGDILRNFIDEKTNHQRAAWPLCRGNRQLRILTIPEWREEIGEREWELVESLPECIADPVAG